jgi:hypothetical protein
MPLLDARGICRRTEIVFRQSRFRPFRATNIDVFLEMLEPVPAVDLIGWKTECIDA